MKNLINFFFSFDKLFKEKLVVPFFWLALIVWALSYSEAMLDSISLDPLAWVIGLIGFFAELFLVLLLIRIVSELMVAIFRINDNLSPDKGRSELADIDPIAEARKAAEMAAARTREMTKTATDKALSATSTKSIEAPKDEDKPSALGTGTVPDPKKEPIPVKALEPSTTDGIAIKKRGRGRPKGSKNKTAAKTETTASVAAPVKRGRGRPKGAKNKTTTDRATKADAATASDTPKRGRGRPKGSKNKTSSEKSAASASTTKRGPGRPKGSKNQSTTAKSTSGKRGPKKGQPIPRDADGNLLKKDGTPRKKPGPRVKD